MYGYLSNKVFKYLIFELISFERTEKENESHILSSMDTLNIILLYKLINNFDKRDDKV